MSEAGGARTPGSRVPARRSSATGPASLAISIAVFGVAAGLVFAELGTRAGLYGVTQYDDGVYFAASLRLTEGALAYRDFVLVQPPGIAVLLAPVAGLAHLVGTREAMAVARVLTGLVAGLNAALVARLLARVGLVAAATGGLALALYPPAYTADHTLMLEPYLVLFLLLGTTAAFSGTRVASGRRLLLAGVLFGVAGSVKTWALLPIVAVVLVALWSIGRPAWRLVAGAAIGAVAFCGVFFVAAPDAFVRDVVVSQLARETARPTPLLSRLWAIDGLSYASGTFVVQKSRHVIEAVTAVLAAVLLLGSALPALRRRASPFEVYVLGGIVGSVALMFVPQQFFDHYAYFSACYLALGLGLALDRLVARAEVVLAVSGRERRLIAAAGVAGLVACSVLVVAPEHAYETELMNRFGDTGATVMAVVPKGACAVSDAETLLVTGDRALSADPRCPTIVDPTGTWLTEDAAHPPVRSGLGPKPAALVAMWAGILRRVDYVVLSGPVGFRIPWTPGLRAELASRFHRDPATDLVVYVADHPPPGSA